MSCSIGIIWTCFVNLSQMTSIALYPCASGNPITKSAGMFGIGFGINFPAGITGNIFPHLTYTTSSNSITHSGHFWVTFESLFISLLMKSETKIGDQNHPKRATFRIHFGLTLFWSPTSWGHSTTTTQPCNNDAPPPFPWPLHYHHHLKTRADWMQHGP